MISLWKCGNIVSAPKKPPYPSDAPISATNNSIQQPQRYPLGNNLVNNNLNIRKRSFANLDIVNSSQTENHNEVVMNMSPPPKKRPRTAYNNYEDSSIPICSTSANNSNTQYPDSNAIPAALPPMQSQHNRYQPIQQQYNHVEHQAMLPQIAGNNNPAQIALNCGSDDNAIQSQSFAASTNTVLPPMQFQNNRYHSSQQQYNQAILPQTATNNNQYPPALNDNQTQIVSDYGAVNNDILSQSFAAPTNTASSTIEGLDIESGFNAFNRSIFNSSESVIFNNSMNQLFENSSVYNGIDIQSPSFSGLNIGSYFIADIDDQMNQSPSNRSMLPPNNINDDTQSLQSYPHASHSNSSLAPNNQYSQYQVLNTR